MTSNQRRRRLTNEEVWKETELRKDKLPILTKEGLTESYRQKRPMSTKTAEAIKKYDGLSDEFEEADLFYE